MGGLKLKRVRVVTPLLVGFPETDFYSLYNMWLVWKNCVSCLEKRLGVVAPFSLVETVLALCVW